MIEKKRMVSLYPISGFDIFFFLAGLFGCGEFDFVRETDCCLFVCLIGVVWERRKR